MKPKIRVVGCHHFAAHSMATGHAAANKPFPRLFQIINSDIFDGKLICRSDSSMVRTAMPHDWPNNSAPEPVKDQRPVGDFFASRLAERIRTDIWRKKLTMIRGEILELSEQSSQQGLVDLTRETVELARTLDRLETLLGLASK
jgi:hypothetical protein